MGWWPSTMDHLNSNIELLVQHIVGSDTTYYVPPCSPHTIHQNTYSYGYTPTRRLLQEYNSPGHGQHDSLSALNSRYTITIPICKWPKSCSYCGSHFKVIFMLLFRYFMHIYSNMIFACIQMFFLVVFAILIKTLSTTLCFCLLLSLSSFFCQCPFVFF